MAANYWTSTQKEYWHFTPDQLADMRDALNKQSQRIIEQYPYPDRRHIFIFIRDRLLQLQSSKHLAFRQQCVATAMTYLQRYFLFIPMQNVNIYLLVATTFYLASKTEEAPHHIRLVASEARQAWPDFIPSDVARLGEMEFCLISEMHSQLIVWHPYRSLVALKESPDLSLTGEEFILAWSIVNDTYMTDLPLTCTPHLIAVTAMFLAIIFIPNKSALNLQNLPQDPQSLRERAFAGLGGRPGVLAALAGAADTLTGGQNAAHSSAGDPANDNESIRLRTIAAAVSSEKMQRVIKFLVESDIDIPQMVQATQEIISLYECWNQYNEKAVREAVTRCLKTRGLDS